MLWKKIFNNQEEVIMEEVMAEEEKVENNIGSSQRGIDLELHIHVHLNDENQVGRAALLLASTTTPDSENELKRELLQNGWRSVATEVGGLAGDLPQKITRALVGASLNAGVVEKTRNEMHALMHAAVEALEGFLTVGMLEASVGAKIAIVRIDRWIAVAVMGDTAYHAVAHHERCGLGVMHI